MKAAYDKAIANTGMADRQDESTEEVPVQQTSLAEDAARTQAKINWLESTVTQDIFKKVQQQIQEVEQKARELAEVTPPNTLLIVKLLQQSTTLRNFLITYGNTTSST